ncbi:MAG: hypothetical protein VXZ35_14560 [Pseudomonadota bacterium]|nr:hypothetical protein [Pseudomonadota bacterium]
MNVWVKSFSLALVMGIQALSVNAAPITSASVTFGLAAADDRVMVDFLNDRIWLRWDLIENVTATYQDALDFAAGSEWNLATVNDALLFADAIIPPNSDGSHGNACVINGGYGQECGNAAVDVSLITGSSPLSGLTYAKFLNVSQFDGVKDIGTIYSDGGSLLKIAEDYLTIEASDANQNGSMGWLFWADRPTQGSGTVPVPGVAYLLGLGILVMLGMRKRS